MRYTGANEVSTLAIIKASSKGQIVIPADIRRRKGMTPGAYIEVTETEDGVLLRSLSDDPIRAARGMFAHVGPLTPGLLEDRRKELEREERDLPLPGGQDTCPRSS